MNAEELNRILRVIVGDMYVGIFARDRLPSEIRRPALIVANTDKASDPGEHWVAIYLNADGTGEFFCSLAHENRHFALYMDRNCSSWICNTRQLQSITSRFCAHYVVVYCALRSRGVNLNTMIKWFTRDYGFNDVLVHNFVCRNKLR